MRDILMFFRIVLIGKVIHGGGDHENRPNMNARTRNNTLNIILIGHRKTPTTFERKFIPAS